MMLSNHDIDKWEDELLQFDSTHAVDHAENPENSTGVFWSYVELEKVVMEIFIFLLS